MFMWNGLDEEGKGNNRDELSHEYIQFSLRLIIWMWSIYLRVNAFISWIEGNIIWVWSIHLRCCVITLESVHYSSHLITIKFLFRCVPMDVIVVLSPLVIVNRNALEDANVGLMQRRILMLSNVTDWEDPMLRWNDIISEGNAIGEYSEVLNSGDSNACNTHSSQWFLYSTSQATLFLWEVRFELKE